MDLSQRKTPPGEWWREAHGGPGGQRHWRHQERCRRGAIAVDPCLLAEIQAYADAASSEWTALAGVRSEPGLVVVSGPLYLPRQIASAASVEVPAEDLADCLLELDAMGVDTNQVRCEIHSHGAMPSFFSATDDEKNMSMTDAPWVVQIVVNRDGQMRGGITQRDPVVTWVELPVVVHVSPELRMACAAELERKVIVQWQREWRRDGDYRAGSACDSYGRGGYDEANQQRDAKYAN